MSSGTPVMVSDRSGDPEFLYGGLDGRLARLETSLDYLRERLETVAQRVEDQSSQLQLAPLLRGALENLEQRLAAAEQEQAANNVARARYDQMLVSHVTACERRAARTEKALWGIAAIVLSSLGLLLRAKLGW